MYKLTALALGLISMSGSSLGCSTTGGVKLTAYGWTNTQAPRQPAFKCNGNTRVPTVPGDHPQLGDGSRGKPYSAAVQVGSIFKECELVYIPMLKKYVRVSDHCAGCTSKWLDIYLVQANKNVGQQQCEVDFGVFNLDGNHPLHEVVQNPGKGFATNTQPLFQDHKCYNKPAEGRVFPGRDGKVKCGGNNGDDAEIATTENVDGNADAVADPNPLDDDPTGRHADDASTSERRSARDFRA